MSASPGMARATLEAAFRIDVRPILPTLAAPIEAIKLAIDSFIAALSHDEFAAMVQRTRGTL